MSVTWVQLRSWHRVVPSRGLQTRTACGRTAGPDAPVSETLPAGKSCETCLRIVAREADA